MGRSVARFGEWNTFINYTEWEIEHFKQEASEGVFEYRGICNEAEWEEARENGDSVVEKIYEDKCQYAWDIFQEDIIEQLRGMFPSLQEPTENKWYDREGLTILENNLVQIVISEYCGLVSLSFVPYCEEEQEGLANHWISSIWEKVCKHIGNLRHVGTFSNGEAIFERS